MKLRPHTLAFAALFSLAACTGQPAPVNFQDSVGTAYAAITGISNTILITCGNTEPGGPCLPGSLVARDDVNKWKAALVEADGLVDAAVVAGNPTDGWKSLQSAQAILREIQTILTNRGVK